MNYFFAAKYFIQAVSPKKQKITYPHYVNITDCLFLLSLTYDTQDTVILYGHCAADRLGARIFRLEARGLHDTYYAGAGGNLYNPRTDPQKRDGRISFAF